MDELMIVANVAIVFGTIYKLFELFAGRKERLSLIEKLGDKINPDTFKNGIFYKPSLFSFNTLRAGCLLIGLGLGVLLGYVIVSINFPQYFSSNETIGNLTETVSTIYASCILIFGGLGLLISYIIELKQSKKE